MDEQLDLAPIEARDEYLMASTLSECRQDRRALLAEVKRLRAQREQEHAEIRRAMDDMGTSSLAHHILRPLVGWPVPAQSETLSECGAPEPPDPPCPECGLQLNASGDEYEHTEECPRSGTCGQIGPPWPDPPFHAWLGDNPDYPLDQSDEDHRSAMHVPIV